MDALRHEVVISLSERGRHLDPPPVVEALCQDGERAVATLLSDAGVLVDVLELCWDGQAWVLDPIPADNYQWEQAGGRWPGKEGGSIRAAVGDREFLIPVGPHGWWEFLQQVPDLRDPACRLRFLEDPEG